MFNRSYRIAWEEPEKRFPLHQPTALIAGTPSIDWLGADLYARRSDGRVLAWRCRFGLERVRPACYDTPAELVAAYPGLPLRDGMAEIRAVLVALGLPYAERFCPITVEQARALAALADEWQIPYAWQEHERREYFHRPVRYASFASRLLE